jgi:hypothetical protein
MTRPAVPAVTDTWYDELGVSQPADEHLGWPFLIFLAGLGAAFGPLHDIVRDTDEGPGWSSVMDPTRCPGWALPWLAQFAGVNLTPGLSEDEWRAQITSPPAFERGTPAAIRSAVQRHLTGNHTVSIIERDGSPWRLTVITYTSETVDAGAAERAARSQKPVGLVLTYRVDPGWSVGDLEAVYAGRTIADVEAEFATVGDVESNLPI